MYLCPRKDINVCICPKQFLGPIHFPGLEGTASARGQAKVVFAVWLRNVARAVPEPTSRGASSVVQLLSEPCPVEPAQGQLPVPAGTWTSTLPTAPGLPEPVARIPSPFSLPAWHRDVLIAFYLTTSPSCLASPPRIPHLQNTNILFDVGSC